MKLLTKEEIENSKFYFISNLDFPSDKKIYPRIPKRRMRYENETTRRICCAKRIYSILKALPLSEIHEANVYEIVPTKNTKFAKPETIDVADCEETQELWCLNPVNLKKIGRIRVRRNGTRRVYTEDPWNPGNKFYFYVNKNIVFDWIEKF